MDTVRLFALAPAPSGMIAEGRIALLLPDLNGGGAERVMLTLAREFSACGHEVDLVLSRAAGVLLSEVPPDVRLVDLGCTPGTGDLALAWCTLRGLVAYLSGTRPQALLSTLNGANLVACLAKRLSGVPTRLCLREANTRLNLRSRVLQAAVGVLYRRADVLVAVSRGVEHELVTHFGRGGPHLRLIPNPVDIRVVQHLANGVPAHPWCRESGPLIVSIGRLAKQKDHQTLIRALQVVRQSVPEVRLVILGEGPERRALSALVRILGLEAAVSLPGFAANPLPVLKRASVFALTSRWEGMPNALLEAAAVGVPLVATDCRSGPREILDDGKLGVLVPVGDVSALAGAIVRQLRAPVRYDSQLALSKRAPTQVARMYLDVLLGSQP